MKIKKIQVLELLRFLSLTEVFLIHFLNDYIHSEEGLNVLMVSGKLGVAFFFMITGYLLVLTSHSNKKGFLKKIITQLLTKYEVLLFFIFIAAKIAPTLFHTFDVSNINFIKSMLLTPYKTPGVQFACLMLPVAWTLGVQMALFVVFLLMIYLFENVDKASVATILSIVLLIVLGSIIGYDNIVLFTYGRFYMLYFITGIGLALAERNIEVLVRIEERIGGDCLKTKFNAVSTTKYSNESLKKIQNDVYQNEKFGVSGQAGGREKTSSVNLYWLASCVSALFVFL